MLVSKNCPAAMPSLVVVHWNPLTGRAARGFPFWMKSIFAVTVLSCSLSLSVGCNQADLSLTSEAHAAPPAAAAPPRAAAAAPLAAAPAAAGQALKLGAPLSAAPVVTVAAVLADPKKYDDKDIKLTGVVGGACQRKGCWMTVGTGEPGANSVRVTFKDYGFFVPKDSMGRKATVEGHFKMTTMSAAEAQHYADDAAKAGAAAKKVTAPQATLALVAQGVELL